MKHTQTFNEFLNESEESLNEAKGMKGPYVAVGYGKMPGAPYDEVIDVKDGFKSEKEAEKWIDKKGNPGLSWSVKSAEEYNHYDLGLNEGFTFLYDGTDIKTPFRDESNMMDVDPDKYYGSAFKKSDIGKNIHWMDELVEMYERWKRGDAYDLDNEDELADFGQAVYPFLEGIYKKMTKIKKSK